MEVDGVAEPQALQLLSFHRTGRTCSATRVIQTHVVYLTSLLIQYVVIEQMLLAKVTSESESETTVLPQFLLLWN